MSQPIRIHSDYRDQIMRCVKYASLQIVKWEDIWVAKEFKSEKDYQGRSLYIHTHAARLIFEEYWTARDISLDHSIAFMARHILERYIYASVAFQSPSSSTRLILAEIIHEIKGAKNGSKYHTSSEEKIAWLEEEKQLEVKKELFQKLNPLARPFDNQNAIFSDFAKSLRKTKEIHRPIFYHNLLSKYIHATTARYIPDEPPPCPKAMDCYVLQSFVLTAEYLRRWIEEGGSGSAEFQALRDELWN